MNPFEVSLAVVSGHGDRSKQSFAVSRPVLYGTAFCVAPSLFLTAGHVFRGAAADGQVAVARLTPGNRYIEPVQDYELFEQCDLALLRCPTFDDAETLPFHFEPLVYLTDVVCLGYPFGWELDPPALHLRAFKGYIVTRRGLPTLPRAPAGYEISFIPPAGLSGAPLITATLSGSPAVVGVILQRYRAECGESSMELGLALDIAEILSLESRIVGGSIAEQLFQRRRVVRQNGP